MERTNQQSTDEQTGSTPNTGPTTRENLPTQVSQAILDYLSTNQRKLVLFVGAILVQFRFDLYIGADDAQGKLVAGTLAVGVHALSHLLIATIAWTGSDTVVQTTRRLQARITTICERFNIPKHLDILKGVLLVGLAFIGASFPLIAVVCATIDFGLAIVFLTIVWIQSVGTSVLSIIAWLKTFPII